MRAYLLPSLTAVQIKGTMYSFVGEPNYKVPGRSKRTPFLPFTEVPNNSWESARIAMDYFIKIKLSETG